MATRKWQVLAAVFIAVSASVVTVKHQFVRPSALVIDLGSSSRLNSFPKGQCTWYAFERSLETGHRFRFTRSHGRDARFWPALAIGVRLSQTPTLGSIMVLGGWKGNEFGHVAFVESVQGTNRWTISHANMGAGTVFATLDGIGIRTCECVRSGSGEVSFSGGRNKFRLIGFLTPRTS